MVVVGIFCSDSKNLFFLYISHIFIERKMAQKILVLCSLKK